MPPGLTSPLYPNAGIETIDLAVMRGFRYWRDPALLPGGRFKIAHRGGYDVTSHGYCANYEGPDGHLDFRGCEGLYGQSALGRGGELTRALGPDELRQGVRETRVIAGQPARVRYSPPDPTTTPASLPRVDLYDPAETERLYNIRALEPSLRAPTSSPSSSSPSPAASSSTPTRRKRPDRRSRSRLLLALALGPGLLPLRLRRQARLGPRPAVSQPVRPRPSRR